jgi:hypothetical protein
MFNSNYIHVNSVIENVLREVPIKTIDQQDAIQWVWEVIGYIDHPATLIEKCVVLSVENYRVLLPEDFYTEAEMGVRHNLSKIPLIKSADIHFMSEYNHPTTTVQSGKVVIEGETMYWDPNGDPVQIEQEVYVSGVLGNGMADTFMKYKIQNGYIYTNISDIELELSYKAFPVYQDYTPMIPEEPKIVRAIESYIKMKLSKKYRWTGEITKELRDEIERDYYLHVGSAINKLKLESIDKTEALKNRAVSLIQRPDEHYRGFNTLGDLQPISKI